MQARVTQAQIKYRLVEGITFLHQSPNFRLVLKLSKTAADSGTYPTPLLQACSPCRLPHIITAHLQHLRAPRQASPHRLASFLAGTSRRILQLRAAGSDRLPRRRAEQHDSHRFEFCSIDTHPPIISNLGASFSPTVTVPRIALLTQARPNQTTIA